MTTIGILCEGEYDFGSLKKIVEKILHDRFGLISSDLNIVEYCANGPTYNSLEKAKTFFVDNPIKGRPSVDIIIFHSDLDNKSDARTNRIDIRDQYIQAHPEIKIALAFPDPNLEHWFFAEKDALIAHFNFPSDIPCADILDPKHRLRTIIGKYGDETKGYGEIYIEIAEKLNINKLISRDNNFQYFVDDLMRTYNAFIQ